MSYEKPEVKKIEADVSVRNMADDKGAASMHLVNEAHINLAN